MDPKKNQRTRDTLFALAPEKCIPFRRLHSLVCIQWRLGCTTFCNTLQNWVESLIVLWTKVLYVKDFSNIWNLDHFARWIYIGTLNAWIKIDILQRKAQTASKIHLHCPLCNAKLRDLATFWILLEKKL